jgi:hypothetical protein
MNLDGHSESEEHQKEGHQLLSMALVQAGSLPDNRAYLDGCSTVTVFKVDKYLKEIKTLPTGIKINCNTGAVLINRLGTYGRMKAWYPPDGIANTLLMHELEKLYCKTFNSWEGYYVVHTPQGQVRFQKDKQGLPFIDPEQSGSNTATILLQNAQEVSRSGTGTVLVQTVRGNFEGYTKKEVLQAKEAHRAQAMISNSSKGDYKGLVSNTMISNHPIMPSNVTNT